MNGKAGYSSFTVAEVQKSMAASIHPTKPHSLLFISIILFFGQVLFCRPVTGTYVMIQGIIC